MNEAQRESIKRIKTLCLELRLALEELDEGPVPPPPDNVRAIRPEEVELEGVIGRPELKEVNGKQVFTAGLGITEGNVTQWHALECWGEAAIHASTVRKGQVVRVVGVCKQVQYVNDLGILCHKKQIRASLVSPVEYVARPPVGSAASR
jgi:hypothetical protein